MPYHGSLAGCGSVFLDPGGTYPDILQLAEVDSYDFETNEDTEDLEDSNGDTIDSFVKKRVLSGSIGLKDFTNSLLAAVTRGVTIAPGRPIQYAYSTTIPTTPFQVTVPLTNPTRTYTRDLGVIDLTAGVEMTCAATATGTGVYAVNVGTGQYTFNTADASHSILISSTATSSTADGTAATIATSGAAATKFGLHLYNTQAGKAFGIYIPAAIIPGISAKFSKGGWVGSTLKWKATKDGSGNLAYTYLPR